MPRDSSGAYTLPSGNPVVDGTVIESVWANDTMSDLAVQMNNVFTRDGLLGPIAPVLFVNGTVPLPGIAFQESPSTGIMRLPPNTVQLVIGGVVRQSWTPTGTTMVGTAAVSGDVTIGGTLAVTGAVTFAGGTTVTGDFSTTGRLYTGDGTAALPAHTFLSEANMGMYRTPAVLGFSLAGLSRMTLNVNGQLSIEKPTNPSAPGLSIKAADGGFALDLRGRNVDNMSILRLLNEAATDHLGTIQYDNANGMIIGSTTANYLQLITNNAIRVQIDSTGNARFLGPLVAAPNFWVAETAGGAGTVGVAGGLGASAVFWGNSSVGSGNLNLSTGAAIALNLVRIPGAVNYFQMQQSGPGAAVLLSADGSDANVHIGVVTKGVGNLTFYSNSVGAGQPQFAVLATSGSNRSITVTGGTVDPVLNVSAGRLNVAAPSIFTSGAAPSAGAVGTTFTYMFNTSIGQVHTGFVNNDDRVHEWYRDNTGLYGRFMNAAFNNGNTWLQTEGGFATGTGSINFFLANPGAGGSYLTMRLARPGTSLGYIGIGLQTSIYSQLQVAGPGQNSAAVFDFGDQGSTLYLWDTTGGPPVNAGGCIKFAAGGTGGVHFAAIKGRINNASGNTTGDLVITTKDTTADTGSTQALLITGTKNLYDYRSLTLVRDPGTTAGTTLPVGAMVLGLIGSGININALTTINAATNNITIQGTSSGTNLTITSGTWRNCGATTTNSLAALWLRVA